MASFVENKERRVIPNWRDFNRTAKLGELNDNSKISNSSFDTSYIKKYIADWQLSKTIGHAAELLNAAFIADYSDSFVLSAAEFIVVNEQWASEELLILARHFRRSNVAEGKHNLLEQDDFDSFQHFFDRENIWKKIAYFKSKVRHEPRNSIGWVELARMYALIGERDKAIDAMEVARSLAPDNRFVVRSSSRLFIHYRDYDRARSAIHRNSFMEVDPWILSIEISLAQ